MDDIRFTNKEQLKQQMQQFLALFLLLQKFLFKPTEGGSLDELFFEVSEIKLINIFLKISVCPFRL